MKFLLICLFFILPYENKQVERDVIIEIRKPILYPTAQEVADYILFRRILFPKIVLKQAILETGWFKSNIYLKSKNMFGFRYQKKYMVFRSWQHCIDYYKKWQERKYLNMNEDYYDFLIRIKYAKSDQYIKTLKGVDISKINFEVSYE
jgi:hypothetical protein